MNRCVEAAAQVTTNGTGERITRAKCFEAACEPYAEAWAADFFLRDAVIMPPAPRASSRPQERAEEASGTG